MFLLALSRAVPLCALICSLGWVGSAFAAGGLSPFEAPITSAADFQPVIQRSYNSHEQVTTVQPFAPIAFTTQIQTLGNVTFSLNREWRVPDVSFADNGFGEQLLDRNGVHLQGEAELRLSASSGLKSKARVPVAASIFGTPGKEQYIETVFFAGFPGAHGNFYKVSAKLINGSTLSDARAVRVSESAFQGRTCGVLGAQGAALSQKLSASNKTPQLAPAGNLSFDISTEADFEYFSAHGNSTNSKIQSILNQVQTIYQDQLGLTFSLIKQVVVKTSGSRYTSSNVETLLDSFRSYTESRNQLGNADVYHLFTGKDTFFLENGSQNSSVIGLAYVGVVCAFPEYAYGLTENFNDALNHITVAHEIGHNFSAPHDAAGSIMGTVLNLNSPPTQFSTASKNQIASHVSANSSCLSNPGASPTPTPGGGTNPGNGSNEVQFEASLTARGALSATVTLDSVDSSCTVTLRASSSSGKVFTGTEIVSDNANFTQTQYSNVIINRKTAVIGNKRQKVHLGVTKTCGDVVYYSAVKSLAPYRIKSSRAGLSVKSWIRLMAKQIQAASPVQL
jgi:hypothetical protein